MDFWQKLKENTFGQPNKVRAGTDSGYSSVNPSRDLTGIANSLKEPEMVKSHEHFATLENYPLANEEWSSFVQYVVKNTNLDKILEKVIVHIEEGFGTNSPNHGPGRASRLKFFEDLSADLRLLQDCTRMILKNSSSDNKIANLQEAIGLFQNIEQKMKSPFKDSSGKFPSLQDLVYYNLFIGGDQVLTELRDKLMDLHALHTLQSLHSSLERKYKDYGTVKEENIAEHLIALRYITRVMYTDFLEKHYATLSSSEGNDPEFSKYLPDLQTLIRYNEPGSPIRPERASAALNRLWEEYLTKNHRSGNFGRCPDELKKAALEDLYQYIDGYIKNLTKVYDFITCTIAIWTSDDAKELNEQTGWDRPFFLDNPIPVEGSEAYASAIKDVPATWEHLQDFWSSVIKSCKMDVKISFYDVKYNKDLSSFQKKRLCEAHIKNNAYFLGKALQKKDNEREIKLLEKALESWMDYDRVLAEQWITHGRFGPQNDEERSRIYWASVDFAMIQQYRLEYDYDRQAIGEKEYEGLKAQIAGQFEDLKKIYEMLPESLKQPKEYTQEDLFKAVEDFSERSPTEWKILIKACEIAAPVDDQLSARLQEVRHHCRRHGGDPEMAVESLAEVMKYLTDPRHFDLIMNKEELQDLLCQVNEVRYKKMYDRLDKEKKFFRTLIRKDYKCAEKSYNSVKSFFEKNPKEENPKFGPLCHALRWVKRASWIWPQASALYAAYQHMKEPEIARLIKEEPALKPVLDLFEEIEKQKKEAGL